MKSPFIKMGKIGKVALKALGLPGHQKKSKKYGK